MTDADFFLANPGRAHRLRLATASEIAEEVKVSEADGWWFAAIRQPEPGVRYGFMFSASWPPPGSAGSEEGARWVFHRIAAGGSRLALSIVTSTSSDGRRR